MEFESLSEARVDVATAENLEAWAPAMFDFIQTQWRENKGNLHPFDYIFKYFDTLEKVKESVLWKPGATQTRLIGAIRDPHNVIVGAIGITIDYDRKTAESALFIDPLQRKKGYGSVAAAWAKRIHAVLPEGIQWSHQELTDQGAQLFRKHDDLHDPLDSK